MDSGQRRPKEQGIRWRSKRYSSKHAAVYFEDWVITRPRAAAVVMLYTECVILILVAANTRNCKAGLSTLSKKDFRKKLLSFRKVVHSSWKRTHWARWNHFDPDRGRGTERQRSREMKRQRDKGTDRQTERQRLVFLIHPHKISYSFCSVSIQKCLLLFLHTHAKVLLRSVKRTNAQSTLFDYLRILQNMGTT